MTIIRFGSKSPLHTSLFYLGNLAPSVFTITWPRDVKGIPEFLQGKTRTYATSEHAYQACKTADPVSARNLRLSTMKAFKRWPSRKNGQIQYEDCYDKKTKAWGLKAIGIVAKMLTTLKADLAKEAFDISFSPNMNLDEDSQWAIWEPILTAKFMQNDTAREILLSTKSATLVEFSRFPGETRNYWGAFIGKDGSVQGKNVMGRFVMRIRSKLAVAIEK